MKENNNRRTKPRKPMELWRTTYKQHSIEVDIETLLTQLQRPDVTYGVFLTEKGEMDNGVGFTTFRVYFRERFGEGGATDE